MAAKFADRNPRIISRELFGECSRYCLVEFEDTILGETRICWFVKDAEVLDEYGMPAVIRQAWTREDALEGLA